MSSLKVRKLNSTFQTPELYLMKKEPIASGDIFSVDNFIHNTIKQQCNSEWDYSAAGCHKDDSQLDPDQALEVAYMRGCVASPYDVAGGGQSLLDAACRVIDSGQIDSHFDTLECYSFLWDMFKEDDASPSSVSQTATTTSASVLSGDEQVISSSSNIVALCDKTTKQNADRDCPPDDVRAFFGHPLTRATNALNGTETDRNVDAVALLHEYKQLPSMEDEDIKVKEKLCNFLDIVRSQQPSPSLSSTPPEISSSQSSENPSPSGRVHINGCGNYEEVAADDCSQNADDMAMTAYVNIFLQDNLHLDDYILCTESAAQDDSKHIVELEPDNFKLEGAKKTKSKKKGLGSALQKRDSKGEVKRVTRKSRTRSDLVTSTTNDLSRQTNGTTVSKGHPGAVYLQPANVGGFLGRCNQFQPEEAVVTSRITSNVMSEVSSTPFNVSSSVLSADGQTTNTSISACKVSLSNCISSVTEQQQANHPNISNLSRLHEIQSPTIEFSLAASSVSNDNTVLQCSSSNKAVTAVSRSATALSASTTNTAPISYSTSVPSSTENPQNVVRESLVKENSDLKRALSEKIRCRQSAEESYLTMPAHTLQFIPDDVSDLRMEAKYAPLTTIKQEDSYMNHFEEQYTYGSDLASGMPPLTNCSALAMTPSANDLQNILPVTMTMCEEGISSNDASNNGHIGMTPSTLRHISNGSTDQLSFHQHLQHHHQLHQQQQCLLNHGSCNQVAEDATIVQSSQGQYFQVLQPIESHHHVTSTNCHSANLNNYYNHVYNGGLNTDMIETNKQMAVGRYLPQQYTYSNGYTQFLNPDNNYSMRSPDSGFHEPCLSPTSSSMTIKETTTGCVDGTKEKHKKKKCSNGGLLTRQYSSSGSEKASPRSPAIQKLDINNTGYTYFLESPISTTQRKDHDRITYLNKSQYYGLSLEFNTQERVIKCAVVKSVIILAFRDERTMDDERKAWEFWHGRQHSYKQRILDIDTKNCQGVLPQNIEELSFNAVAVKWNPMEGPVKVNIAVHCLSTDFSNQKGVKGIPLHIQIDTYEQSPKGNNLVHRGYCQIKAFCDKGAERKTRDEERRKAAKGKPDEFGHVPASNKSRKKVEEVFHEPYERSEFYSMANTITEPVFFNPLYENTEFIHKSLTVGVVPSQDEEISSLPNKLDLPDSCDDYYINSPVKKPRRDSISNLKDQQKVLLYIRERHETAYTALMLEVPTLHGLLRSIELKYSIAPSKVKNLYKKSRKGILVKLDDNIVRHYSHEATFIIERNVVNENGDYEIILVEIDPVTS